MTAYQHNNIMERLDRDERRGTIPPLLVQFYGRLLQIQSETEQRIVTPGPLLSTCTIEERLQSGQPLLNFDELPLDWPLVEETFEKVAAAFAEHAELFGKPPGAVKRNTLSQETVKKWFAGSPFDGDALIQDVLHATLKPFLVSFSMTLLGSLPQEKWRRGYCPVCGGNPDFALLKGENGTRWLVCSRCDAEWLFQRLECPYCGNQTQDSLAYYTNDKGSNRLYVCEKCKRYIKALDTRQAKHRLILPVERLFSLDIDRQGQELGYSPCDSSRGNE